MEDTRLAIRIDAIPNGAIQIIVKSHKKSVIKTKDLAFEAFRCRKFVVPDNIKLVPKLHKDSEGTINKMALILSQKTNLNSNSTAKANIKFNSESTLKK